jgi:hypothetical protein
MPQGSIQLFESSTAGSADGDFEEYAEDEDSAG